MRVAALLLLLGLAPVWAQVATELPPMIKASLVSESSAIVPGKPFTVGLYLQHKKGWHTYWQNPGDVGIPPIPRWDLPADWKVGPVQYQAPNKVKMFDITAHGFSGVDALHLVELTPPKTLVQTNRFELRADVTWMVCGRSCHPGTYRLSTVLPVSSKSEITAWRSAFEKVREAHPRKNPAWKATAKKTEITIVLQLQPTSTDARESPEIAVYYGLDKQVFSNRKHLFTPVGKGLRLDLPRSDYGPEDKPDLEAVLYTPSGWLANGDLHYLHIHIPFERP